MKQDLLLVKPFQETLFKSVCGPASLKMVFSYYGYDKTEQDIAETCGTTEELGTDDQGIKKVADGMGFKVEIKNNSTFKDR